MKLLCALNKDNNLCGLCLFIFMPDKYLPASAIIANLIARMKGNSNDLDFNKHKNLTTGNLTKSHEKVFK